MHEPHTAEGPLIPMHGDRLLGQPGLVPPHQSDAPQYWEPAHPDYAAPARFLNCLFSVRTDPVAVRDMITAARFWYQVEQTETCWLWRGPMLVTRATGNRMPGYRVSQTSRDATRLAWQLMNGKQLPPRVHLKRNCADDRCVRPDPAHVWLAHVMAVSDMEAESARDVAICSMYRTGQFTYAKIGELFGITRERVRQIIVANEMAPTSAEPEGVANAQ